MPLPALINPNLLLPPLYEQQPGPAPCFHSKDHSHGAYSKDLDYKAIIGLFEHPSTQLLFDRHAITLEKLFSSYSGGIRLSELEPLEKILRLLHTCSAHGGANVFKDILAKKLHYLCLPFISDAEMSFKTIDEHLSRIIVNLVQLATDMPNLVSIVLKIIQQFSGYARFTLKLQQQKKPSLEKSTLTQFKVVEEESGLIDVPIDHPLAFEKCEIGHQLCILLDKIPNNSHSVDILILLRRFSFISALRHQISKDPYSTSVLSKKLQAADYSAKSIIVEVMWNLMTDSEGAEQATCLFSEKETLQRLLDGFFALCAKAQRVIEKQLCCDFLVFILIAKHCPASHAVFNELDAIPMLLSALCQDRFPSPTGDIVHLTYLQNSVQENFEFKQLLLSLIVHLCDDDLNLSIALEDELIDFLLKFLEFERLPKSVQFWSQRQLKEFQLNILGILRVLLPRCDCQPMLHPLSRILLHYVDNAIRHETEMMVQHNVESEPMGLVCASLRVVYQFAAMGEGYQRALGQASAFDYLLEIVSDKSQSLETWSNCLLICSTLCQDYFHNRHLFGLCEGVSKLIELLSFDSPHIEEKEFLLFCTIECIWGAVCGNWDNELLFFEKNGLFLLLDYLESTPFYLKQHILGTLVDLLENPKARYHIMEWRSKENSQHRIANLLIHLWNDEEEKLGVPQGPYRTLVDIQNPLVGKRMEMKLKKDKAGGYQANEFSEPFRVKIYAMLCHLGFQSCKIGLSTEERVKLILIQKYLDFKLGEAWDEIETELHFDGIRPISPDLESISIAKQVVRKKASQVQVKQQSVIKRELEAEKRVENAFYHHYLHYHKHELQHEYVSLLQPQPREAKKGTRLKKGQIITQ